MTFPHGIKTSAGQFFGCSPDAPDDRAKRTPVHRLMAGLPAQALPAASSLAAYRAPVFSQGRSGSCFPAGTPILMADGTECPIEDVAVGNEVFTHAGKKRTVTKVSHRRFSGSLYSIQLSGFCYRTTTTPEHPICVVRIDQTRKCSDIGGEKIEWVRATDLKLGDFVLMPANTRPEEPKAPQTISVRPYIEGDVWEGDGLIRCLHARRPSTIPSRITIDERFARLVGLFLAEGSYRKISGQIGGLNFTFARHERDYQQFVLCAIRDIFGADAELREESTRQSVTDVRINNATLGRLFFGMCGEGALYKRVPIMFYESARNIKLALLRGWAEGDGTQDLIPDHRRSIQMCAATSSEELHRGMLRIALLCGMKPGVTVRRQLEYQNAPPRLLYFYGESALELFPAARERAAVRGIETDGSTLYRYHALGFACPIKSIETSNSEEIDVYNLEVDGEHTYVANFMAVHNCWGHASAQATYTALAAGGSPLPFVPSPWFGYANARIEDLASPGDPLQDIGSRPALGVKALSLYGVRRMLVEKTPDGRFSDVWGPEDAPNPNVNVKPTFEDEELGVENLIVGEYGIDPADVSMEDHIKATIAVARQPVVVGAFVDSAFIYWTPDQAPLDSVNMSDPLGGGHAFVIDEYASGGTIYTVTNSWGQGGERKVTGNWLRTAWDLLAWTVRRA